MIRVDLLPRRYQENKALEKFLRLTVALLALVTLIIGSLTLSLDIRTQMYQNETAALRSLATQYKQVNMRYVELEQAEKTLQHRLDLALPLLEAKRSIQPLLTTFLTELPENIRLTRLSAELEGRVQLEGEAVTYTDVAAFIKWLEDERGFVSHLDKIQRLDKTVSFIIIASTQGGGIK